MGAGNPRADVTPLMWYLVSHAILPSHGNDCTRPRFRMCVHARGNAYMENNVRVAKRISCNHSWLSLARTYLGIAWSENEMAAFEKVYDYRSTGPGFLPPWEGTHFGVPPETPMLVNISLALQFFRGRGSQLPLHVALCPNMKLLRKIPPKSFHQRTELFGV